MEAGRQKHHVSRPSTNSNGWPKAFSLTEASAGGPRPRRDGRGASTRPAGQRPQAGRPQGPQPQQQQHSPSSWGGRRPGCCSACCGAQPAGRVGRGCPPPSTGHHRGAAPPAACRAPVAQPGVGAPACRGARAGHRGASGSQRPVCRLLPAPQVGSTGAVLLQACLHARCARMPSPLCTACRTVILTVARLAVFVSPAWREVREQEIVACWLSILLHSFLQMPHRGPTLPRCATCRCCRRCCWTAPPSQGSWGL